MNDFSIAQLSQFSGIKPHTIRIWEQRYNALAPKRSEGNVRRYDGSQLKRLLNIVSLLEMDYKISDVGHLSDQKINSLLTKSGDHVNNFYDPFISNLITAALEFDEAAFEKIFSHCLLKYGMEKTYMEVLYPMLEKVGLMWSTNLLDPGNEHFISNLVRQKIITAIDSLPSFESRKKTWLLFLPENEFHEIGLLMANYLLRLYGRRTVYLGANAPLETIAAVAKNTGIQNWLLFLVRNQNPDEIACYISTLKIGGNHAKIYLAGEKMLLDKIKNIPSVQKITSIEEFKKNIIGIVQ